MFRGIVGLCEGDPDGKIKNNRGRTNIQGERIESFDGGSLVTGSASGVVTRDRDIPVVGEDFITIEREKEFREVYVEFLADLPSGWITVDSSDGEFLWDFLSLKHNVEIKRAEIDVNALASEIREWGDAEVWQSQTDWGDTEDEIAAGGVTIAYHSDASWPSGDRTDQLGFEGLWDGVYVRGTVARSGYLALYDGDTDELAGEFVSEVLVPHCSIPEDEQDTLGGASS